MSETNSPKHGVFWIIEGKLFAFAFEEGKYPEALAKSQETYVHEKLWRVVCPKDCVKPYNYYPRGRVHIAKNGTVHLYLSPHITDESVAEIKAFFGIVGEAKIHYDHSAHYRCYLDTDWRAQP